MEKQYTYAAARVHAMEGALMSASDIQQLLSLDSADAVLNALSNKGYGGGAKNAEELMENERAVLSRIISELSENNDALDIFRLEYDFHNLKAIIKSGFTKASSGVTIGGGLTDIELIRRAISDKAFELLPEYLKKAARAALKVMQESGDGGLCDIIVDRAYLEELCDAARKSGSSFIKEYAYLTADNANIRIALRGASLDKPRQFFERAFADTCEVGADMRRERLIDAASKGFDETIKYLEESGNSGAAAAAKKSFAALEKWCDDSLMSVLKKQKYDNFTVAPIAAFMLAKEAEIRAVGLVLTAKQNRLDENIIKERLRELYV